MRIEYNERGYVQCILYGCYTGRCSEYTGLVPTQPEEYKDIDDWANRAKVTAYYLDDNGNLAYDPEVAATIPDEGDSVKTVSYENMVFSNTNFAAYGDEFTPRISRTGDIVFLDGLAKNTVALEEKFGEVIATLPEWARPAMDVFALHQGSDKAMFWLRVYASGNVEISRYRDETGYKDISAGRQFPLTLNWIAADAYPSN